MAEALSADYVVVGAGAAGMAFADAVVGHSDAEVVIVDRRHAPGGHWVDAYPFVRLHQASLFYGVAGEQLGDGSVQTSGPEQGLQERATAPEICAYYTRVMDRLVRTGQVRFLPGCDWLADGRARSRASGKEYAVSARRAVVDAHYLEPMIPATTPAPFEVGDGARVIPVNELVRLDGAPSRYAIVGSGKTATDSIVWLLGNGVDPDRICWIRPRDPWLLNRAKVQPDPAVFLGIGADMMEAAATASSLDQMFLRLEEAGVVLRIDTAITPTMARTPTLAQWELDLLRSVDDVVRLGHVRHVDPGRMVLDDGTVPLAADTVVVHCAAAGLRDRPSVPIWGEGTITVQPTRAGFPCFGAAMIGYVEATRGDTDEKNRVCPPSTYPNSLADWTRMQVLGARSAAAFNAEPDIAAWANDCLLNPARVPAEKAGDPAVGAVKERIAAAGGPGLARMAELAGL
ncbi:hypothetical protein HNR19_002747 [Nocardioides thalensis]|uniref:NAD(P)/FAD-dependent oxidoreductase n=1 Tax=Nocardioides thalensis TaxID=1914755 RepID=A0A853C420_9ACTN|nr:NAD(P)-binding protein [Nocardioides thalensis]NYJ02049.1 hypothetical protein [Nocardioides thalensis]